MKILHLIRDHQVIERTLGIYEKLFPGSNIVLIVSNAREIRHLKKYADSRVITNDNVDQIGASFDFSVITHVIAHYMAINTIRFIHYVPIGIDVTWEIYGADLYNQFLLPFGYPVYYEDPSRYPDRHFVLKRYLTSFYRLIERLFYKQPITREDTEAYFKEITSRVDSLQYCCKNDARLVELYSGRSIPSYEIFNYSLHEVLGDLYDSPFNKGADIMVGNSSSFSNNHMYLIDYLRLLLEGDERIIIPLSYGGTRRYAKKVQIEYKKAFGERVLPLLDYMPLHEYNKLLTSVNSIVLGNWRQEAQGTAIMGFYLGAKVFMSEKSPLFHWFKELHFHVFPIESASKGDLEKPLSEIERRHNRQLVIDYYNENVLEERLIAHFSPKVNS